MIWEGLPRGSSPAQGPGNPFGQIPDATSGPYRCCGDAGAAFHFIQLVLASLLFFYGLSLSLTGARAPGRYGEMVVTEGVLAGQIIHLDIAVDGSANFTSNDIVELDVEAITYVS